MNTQAPFGIVTGCHAGDKFMVQATLASIRHFMPDVPVCLIQDGDFDISDIVREYDPIVLRPSELPDPSMRRFMCGNYRAKLAALWEGPFESYVWLDSDAIVWGDFRSALRFDCDFQIFWSEISVPSDATTVPGWLPHFYFDLEKLKLFDPSFEWRGLPYFCSGAFHVKRNAISWDDWQMAEGWLAETPGLFAWGEMGILNYLVHRGAQNGTLNVEWTDLQYLWRHHGTEELVRDCHGCGFRFPNRIERPKVVHFPGRKPFMYDRKSYSRPFTIARLEHYRRERGEIGAWLKVWAEEAGIVRTKAVRRLGRLFGGSGKG